VKGRSASRLVADPDRIVRLLQLRDWHVLSGECGWVALTTTGHQVHGPSPHALLERIARRA
jgi:hypothetical protein